MHRIEGHSGGQAGQAWACLQSSGLMCVPMCGRRPIPAPTHTARAAAVGVPIRGRATPTGAAKPSLQAAPTWSEKAYVAEGRYNIKIQ